MKKTFPLLVACLAVATTPLYAHHMAEGIVDDEVYAMIDSLVADTPHATLDFEEMDSGDTAIVVGAQTLRSLENMIDDGLLEYAQVLDGEVVVEIDFLEQGQVEMIITQLQ